LERVDYIGIDAYFPLSDATTPSVAALMKLGKDIIKIEKLQAKTNKKILFTEFGYRNSDQRQKSRGRCENTINILAQSYA
jgi:hypothetical protein